MPLSVKHLPIKKLLWRGFLFLLTLIIFLIALKTLKEIAGSIQPQEVWAALQQIPAFDIFLAALVVAFGYLILTLYDAIAFRHLGVKLRFRKVAMTSFTAYAIGHTIGLAVLTASGVRYRMYRVNGISRQSIAHVVWLVSMAFTFGISTLIGLSLAINPQAIVRMMHQFDLQLADLSTKADVPSLFTNVLAIRSFGLLLLAVVAALLIWSGKDGKQVDVKGWRISLPPAVILLQQLLISIIDLASVAFVLYLLLPKEVGVTYLSVFSAFIQSIAMGILSHVPGGLGVFEVTMVASLPQVDKVYLLAVLLVFRLLYYIIPFLLAVLLFTAHEVWIRWHKFSDSR